MKRVHGIKPEHYILKIKFIKNHFNSPKFYFFFSMIPEVLEA